MWRIVLLASSLLVSVGCSSYDDTIEGEVSVAHLWSQSANRTERVKEDIYIRGRVVLNDKFGERPNALVVADNTGCVEIKVESDNVESLVPLGSEVVVRCAGLSLGREGRNVVLGEPPTGEYAVNRIAETHIYNYIKVVGYDVSTYETRRLHIADIVEARIREFVEVIDVWFVEREAKCAWCARDTLGRFTTTLRHITDGRDTLPVVVAGTSDYASEPLPLGVQCCSGVVEWYDRRVALRIAHREVNDSM